MQIGKISVYLAVNLEVRKLSQAFTANDPLRNGLLYFAKRNETKRVNLYCILRNQLFEDSSDI